MNLRKNSLFFYSFFLCLFAVFALSCRETVRTADDYYAAKRYDRAAEEYRQFIKDNPKLLSLPNAYLGLAWSEYQLGNYPEAEGAVAILMTRYPGHYLEPQARYLKAHILFAQRKFVECSEELEDFLLKFPDNSLVPDVRVLLARSAAAQLRFAEAADEYKMYLERYGNGPYVPAALIGRAKALEKSAKWQEAAETLEEFIKRFPKHLERPQAMLDLARYKMAYADYSSAENLLLELINVYSMPDLTLSAQKMLLDIYDAERKIDDAANIARNLLGLIDPRNDTEAAKLVFRLAQYHAARGDTSAARNYFRRIAERMDFDSAKHAYALFWLTIDEMSRGNREEALAFGERFLSLYPSNPEYEKIDRIIIDVYFSAGRTADGAANLETLLKREWSTAAPKDFYRLASSYIDLKDYNSAMRNVAEGLKRSERAGDTPSILSGLYHSMILNNLLGNSAKAVESWWRLKSISENYVTVSEKVFWDDMEEQFYRENRITPQMRERSQFSEEKQKVNVEGFEWKLGDISAMKLSNSLFMTFASSTQANQDFEYAPKSLTNYIDEMVRMHDFDNIPDTWYPLRSSIGADWIVHGRITGDEYDTNILILDLRLLRVDYEKIFPFEYSYKINLSEEPTVASRIVRESIDRMRTYKPSR